MIEDRDKSANNNTGKNEEDVATKYGYIPAVLMEEYTKILINKVFKILPMREKSEPTLDTYLESFVIELVGNKSLIEHLKYEPLFMSLLSTLEYFVENPDTEISVYKREVFKCIDIVKKIQDKYDLASKQ